MLSNSGREYEWWSELGQLAKLGRGQKCKFCDLTPTDYSSWALNQTLVSLNSDFPSLTSSGLGEM